MTANVKLPLSDGSTQVVKVIMFQQHNGDLFISDLSNGGTLDNLEITNIEITQITDIHSTGWYSNQSVSNTSFAPVVAANLDGIVDGTNASETIDANFADADGDCVYANDQQLPGEATNYDIILAGGGDDFVLAGASADEVFSGTGDDTLCAQHEVVLYNGAWTESFQPGDYSLRGIGDAQSKELITLFPELPTFEGVSNYGAARATLRSHEAKLIN